MNTVLSGRVVATRALRRGFQRSVGKSGAGAQRIKLVLKVCQLLARHDLNSRQFLKDFNPLIIQQPISLGLIGGAQAGILMHFQVDRDILTLEFAEFLRDARHRLAIASAESALESLSAISRRNSRSFPIHECSAGRFASASGR